MTGLNYNESRPRFFLRFFRFFRDPLITISTESGDGRHNDVKRELSGIFHAITGAGGRFKTGQILDVKAEGLDVYNTMLTAMGAKDRIGPEKRKMTNVDAIRA